MEKNYDYLFKLLLIGDSGVGKTCLLQRFANDTFDYSMLNTIAIDFNNKMFQVDDKIVNLRIWDTAGQERFRSITYSYYRDADGIILVYDVTNQKSFDNIPIWLEEIKRYGKPNVIKLLVGNKSDLKEKRVVDYKTAKKFAEKIGINLIETSAKDSKNVKETFVEVIKEIITNLDDKEWVEISTPINVAKKNKSNWADNCCF